MTHVSDAELRDAMNVAAALARDYVRGLPPGFAWDEGAIHGEAQLGVALACEKFDPSLKVRFATYARQWAFNRMYHEVRRQRAARADSLDAMAVERADQPDHEANPARTVERRFMGAWVRAPRRRRARGWAVPR
jgi:hypothetical protein